MGNRLSKIATRTGDDGTTGLGNGSRVSKRDLRVHAMGDVDELNATIGVLLTEDLPEEVRLVLTGIQHELFNLGGELSIPGMTLLGAEAIIHLDKQLEHFNHELPPLKEFILPGGTRATSFAHICRTVARRAERAVVSLASVESVRPEIGKYLNRLSDLMFVLARVLNRVNPNQIRGDVYWKSARLEPGGEAP
jgi:cob(I)alamin adenosyltransferase